MAYKRVYIATAEDSIISSDEQFFHEQLYKAIDDHESCTYTPNADSADIVVLFEAWSTKFAEYTNILCGDNFISNNWRKLYVINWDDIGRGFLPGIYTSLNPKNFDSGMHKSTVYPRTYNKEVERAHEQREPSYLSTFRGTLRSSELRMRLGEAVAGDPRIRLTTVDQKFHTHTRNQHQEYVEDILSAHSVLCPRGWSPSTYRMFEAMALGRCPVIISDDWIKIEAVEWEACSIRVSENELPHLSAILSERETDLPELSRQAYEVYWTHFSTEKRFGFYLDQIFDLHNSRADLDYRKQWEKKEFLKAQGFDFASRLRSWIRRRLPILNII